MELLRRKEPLTLPVKVLQFGEGNFLRCFVDYLIQQMNDKAGFGGAVRIVQPLPQGMCDAINAQDGVYHCVLRGVADGRAVETIERIDCVESCLNPAREWDRVQATALLPELRFVFSNTTEAGIAYDPSVKADDKPQASFPGKVTAFLYRRYRTFKGDTKKGLVFIPCELIDKNGATLRKYVLQHASDWNLGEDFANWVEASCDFCNSLVDRIVPGYPKAEKEEIEKQVGYTDNLLDAAEIFHFWAIEYTKKSYEDELPLAKAGLNVVWTDDMSFFRTRKVRILNGAHTLTVLAAHQAGLDTVKQCIDTDYVYAFMKKGLFEEIIPSMDGDKDLLVNYAKDVLDRFKNPYIVHLLMSISLNSVSKFKTRDLPSLKGYYEKTGKLPEALCFSLASLISFYEGTEIREGALVGNRNGEEYMIKDSPDVLETFSRLYKEEYCCAEKKAETLAKAVVGNETWWGEDLEKSLPGITEKVAENLKAIWTDGMQASMKAILEK